MNHGDADVGHVPFSLWIHERRKPKGKKAMVGGWGTIANCVAGDLVACESRDRRRVIWLQIAWMWPDGKAAQVRLYDRRTGEISLHGSHLRTVMTTQRVRFLGVREK